MRSGIERHTAEALRWAEQVTGGRILAKRRQARWRPHWFLEIDDGSSDPLAVMLRGFRNPGYLHDEKRARESLATEAGVIRSLQGTGVKVPRFYGFHEEYSWILMEWLPGTELLTDVEEEDRRFALFRQYMDHVAVLHTLDWEKLDLPPGLPRPSSWRDSVVGGFEHTVARYRSFAGIDPEPLLELGIRWIFDHVPEQPRPIRLCGGDIGPNQFMFEGDRVLGMFDLEIAHLGDPLQDLGLMRLREMDYPIGRLPEHLRHWSTRTGFELDIDVLQYWTMIGMVSAPILFAEAMQRPDPGLVDQMALYAFVPIHRRGVAESLMEIYGIEPELPERPLPAVTPRSNAHELLVRQLEEEFAPTARDEEERFFLECSAALARHLALGNEVGPQLERQDLEEMGEVLGRRPADRLAGLASLERAIESDYERDLERRLKLFHRMEVRREYLWEPVQRAAGFTSNHPLTRMQARHR